MSDETREERAAKLEAHQRKMLKKYGFYAHFVFPTVNEAPARGRGPHYANYHTHGFPESYDGQLDMQIVMPMDPRSAHGILMEVNEKLKAGERFGAGDMIAGVLTPPYEIRLFKTTETGREVLRLVFPDKDGKFPGDAGVDPVYGGQEAAIVDDVTDSERN